MLNNVIMVSISQNLITVSGILMILLYMSYIYVFPNNAGYGK